jgi:formiminotetrahydrofolate cyclodeaminase
VTTALHRATETPLAVVAAARDVLALAETTAHGARASTLADLSVAVALARGVLDGAAATARANLRDLRDAEFAGAAERRLSALTTEGATLAARAARVIAERTGPRA